MNANATACDVCGIDLFHIRPYRRGKKNYRLCEKCSRIWENERLKPEEVLQIRTIDHFKRLEHECGFMVLAISNEAAKAAGAYDGNKGRVINQIQKQKRMGMRDGAADVPFFKLNRYILIELKSKDGRQSESQKDFEWDVRRIGGEYHVCRSLAEILDLPVIRDFILQPATLPIPPVRKKKRHKLNDVDLPFDN